jgi:hypothetical protein
VAFTERYLIWADKQDEKNIPKIIYDGFITPPLEVWSSMHKGSDIQLIKNQVLRIGHENGNLFYFSWCVG